MSRMQHAAAPRAIAALAVALAVVTTLPIATIATAAAIIATAVIISIFAATDYRSSECWPKPVCRFKSWPDLFFNNPSRF